MSELLSCPICGGDPGPYASAGDCEVACTKCGLKTAVYGHLDSAIAAWNRRATPAATQEAVGLRTALQRAVSWFDEYAAGHRFKGAIEKAERNQLRADDLRAALAASGHAPTAWEDADWHWHSGYTFGLWMARLAAAPFGHEVNAEINKLLAERKTVEPCREPYPVVIAASGHGDGGERG